MPGCFVHTLPFSSPCDAMLTMFVCATRWLSMHLNKLAHMSMHESCLLLCRPCFNTIKSWIQTYICPSWTPPFVLLSCLFAFLLVCLLSCFFACHVYHVYLLYAFFICLLLLSFHCLSAGFLSLPCTYME